MGVGNATESVQMAFGTLRKNRLRSALTIFGISIGISMVILTSSAINGLNRNIYELVSSLGTNNLWVFRFKPWGNRLTTEELNRKQLTYEDAIAMRNLPYVVAVNPVLTYQNVQFNIGNVSLKNGTHKIQNTIISGSTSEVEKTNNIALLEGRIWTESEEEHNAKVVVLGHDAAEDLFLYESPIGKDVECEGEVFTVIGVLDLQPKAFGSGRNTADNSAYFPLETFHKLHPELKDFWITVKYDDPAHKAIVMEEIRELLRVRRGVRLEQDDNFSISSPESLARLWKSLTSGLFLFMVGVSSLGLVVGGVGVMNIMLVTVTERTREIGIRKAIGATQYNILLQFTLEAVTLCAVGGMLGVLAGCLFTAILHSTVLFLHAALSFAWVLISFIVSCTIGLLAGIYPAWRASRLDPVEALRYE
jgi:putative ABC transport system permease protein